MYNIIAIEMERFEDSFKYIFNQFLSKDKSEDKPNEIECVTIEIDHEFVPCDYEISVRVKGMEDELFLTLREIHKQYNFQSNKLYGFFEIICSGITPFYEGSGKEEVLSQLSKKLIT